MKIEKFCVGLAFLLGVLCPCSFAQVPQIVEGAARAVGESTTQAMAGNIGRALVRQVPLTAEEMALLPVNGSPTHSICYQLVNEPGIAEIDPTQKYGQVTLTKFNLPLSKMLSHNIKWIHYNYGLTLPEELFPNYARLDEQASERWLRNVVNNFEKWAPHETEFLKYLKREVYQTIPWENYFPTEPVDFIFAGETHRDYDVHQSIFQLVKALRKRNPNRRMIFATEYVGDTLEKSTFADRPAPVLLRTKEELDRALKGRKGPTLQILEDVMNLGIDIVGIEPDSALEDAFLKERGLTEMTEAEMENFYMFARSKVIVKERNRKWVEHLEDLHAQYPDALIVVHGGAAHMNRNTLFSVPNLLKEKSFVVQNITMENLVYISPSFYQEICRTESPKSFDKAEAKKVISFKPEFYQLAPDMQELYKKAWGADVIVTFSDILPEHEREMLNSLPKEESEGPRFIGATSIEDLQRQLKELEKKVNKR